VAEERLVPAAGDCYVAVEAAVANRQRDLVPAAEMLPEARPLVVRRLRVRRREARQTDLPRPRSAEAALDAAEARRQAAHQMDLQQSGRREQSPAPKAEQASERRQWAAAKAPALRPRQTDRCYQRSVESPRGQAELPPEEARSGQNCGAPLFRRV
jgi:hypothetical protein